MLWVAELGSQSYGGPVLYKDRIFAGTNNERLRNPKLTGDRGVLMVFDAESGAFVWQSAHAKLAAGRVNDWPLQGICDGPHVEGDRLYYVSNRAELIAADVAGFRDGENDGPFTGETETGETDEDVVWKLDMIAELDVFPHNQAAGNPLVVGDLVFTTTGQGVDEAHINVPVPKAPSFIAVNRLTGKLVWEDASPGSKILHGTWSNPAYGVVKGRPQVIFPGDDGWIYSFDPATGKPLWKFDANPKDSKWVIGGAGTRNNLIATPVIHDDKVYIGVGQDPEHGEGIGHFYAIDATKDGDVTRAAGCGTAAATTPPHHLHRRHRRRHRLRRRPLGLPLRARRETGSCTGSTTPSRRSGAPPSSPTAASTSATKTATWWCSRRASRRSCSARSTWQRLLSTPVAKDGVLYVMGRNKLFALKNGARWTPPAAKPARRRPRRRGGALSGRRRHRRGGGSGPGGPHRRSPRDLDAHVREMVAWHFGPETGCPFWLDRAQQLGFDPRERIRGYDDLACLGHFQDEWLRGGPVRRWVPKAYAEEPIYVFETGGSTGVPKSRLNVHDLRIDYSLYAETLSDAAFPRGADWLMLGPTRPRGLRLGIEHLAQVRGGIAFPRRPRPALGQQRSATAAARAQAYKTHSSPGPDAAARARLDPLPVRTQAARGAVREDRPAARGITASVCAGTEMTPQFHRFAREELVPGIEFVTHTQHAGGARRRQALRRRRRIRHHYYACSRAVFESSTPTTASARSATARPGGDADDAHQGALPAAFLERDEAERAAPSALTRGTRHHLRPFSRLAESVVVGVY